MSLVRFGIYFSGFFIQRNLVLFQIFGINKFPDSRNDSINLKFFKFVWYRNYISTTVCTCFSQLHLLTFQNAICIIDWKNKFFEDYTFMNGLMKFIVIGGHKFFSSSIEDIDFFDARSAQRGSCTVHSRTTCPNDSDSFTKGSYFMIMIIYQEFNSVNDLTLIPLELDSVWGSCSDSKENIFISFFLEFRDG